MPESQIGYLDDQSLHDIAECIRGKLDVSTEYYPREMSAAIDSISSSGSPYPLLTPPTSDRNYLYFQADEDNAVIGFNTPGTPFDVGYEMSTDGTNWSGCTYEDDSDYLTITLVHRGDYVFIRAKNTIEPWNNHTAQNKVRFTITGKRVLCGGSIMSLFSRDLSVLAIPSTASPFAYMFQDCDGLLSMPEIDCAVLPAYCCEYMFSDCASLCITRELPASVVGNNCYQYMFQNCNSLRRTPSINATTAGNYACNYMFSDCKSLEVVGDILIQTMGGYCCQYMFSKCTMLKYAKVLPSMTLSDYCYQYMFVGCVSLKNAPDLPAETLTQYCYSHMFDGCTSLEEPPVISALVLADHCCFYMFTECTSLKTPPELLSTSLDNSCYSRMFYNCHSLKSMPYLPADTLKNLCYNNMFNGCTSLTDVSDLSATTLASECYKGMFRNCTSLTTGPSILATDALDASVDMFNGCTRLNKLTCLYSTSSSSYTGTWLANVSSRGTFYKNPSNSTWLRSSSGIPSGWTVVDYVDYFYLENISGRSAYFSMTKVGTISSTDLKYSTDMETWEDIPETPIKVKHNKRIYLRSSTGLSYDGDNYVSIRMDADFRCGGDIMTLINYTGTSTAMPAYGFYKLFYNATYLKEVPNLTATSISDCCYGYMFAGCTSITYAKHNSAVASYANECYTHMYDGCTGIVSAQDFPNVAPRKFSFSNMFRGCISLKTAPELPASTLAQGCYSNMFENCTSLFSAKTGDITTTDDYCCEQMFKGCTSLAVVNIPIKSTSYMSYVGMFMNCVLLKSSPTLYATALAPHCYEYMFYGCTSLERITCYAEHFGDGSTYEWTYGVSQTGAFFGIEKVDWSRDEHGIPKEWYTKDVQILNFSSHDPFFLTYVYGTYVCSGCSTDKKCDGALIDCDIDAYIKNADLPKLELSFDCDKWYSFEITYLPYYDSCVQDYNCEYCEQYGFDCKKDDAYYNEVRFAIVAAAIEVPGKETIYVRGSNSSFHSSTDVIDNGDWITHCGFKFTEGQPFVVSSGHDSNIYAHVFCDGDTTSIINLVGGDYDMSSCGFQYMFCDQNIESSPRLPSTKIGDNAYSHMFDNCNYLTIAPELPATLVGNYAYSYMFTKCGSLTNSPPSIVTIDINQHCCDNMFYDCAHLEKAPDIVTNSIYDYGCYGMFYNCGRLYSKISIMANSVGEHGCESMCYNCTSLTDTPDIYLTEISAYCYSHMFHGCSGLRYTMPLPATTLAPHCYDNMFYNCSSINVPTGQSLPATTLAPYCYAGMFARCTSLDNVPEMHPTTVADYCCSYMFLKCSALKRVVLAQELPATALAPHCYEYMFSESGLLDAPVISAMAVADSCCLGMFKDCVSLVDVQSELSATTLAPYCYAEMFSGCGSLVDAPNVPAEIVADSCCMSMFYGCTSLSNIQSELPATTLAPHCYDNMFYGCESLADMPKLPATELSQYCYAYMFYGCSTLRHVLNLPATRLAPYCYTYMFYGCELLENAPVIYATSAAENCCNSMFRGCVLLSVVQNTLYPLSLAQSCYAYMFYGCTSLETMPELPAMALAPYCYESMFRGCTALYIVSELPAQSLEIYCYYYMFSGCTSLTDAPRIYAQSSLQSRSLSHMFSNCTRLNRIILVNDLTWNTTNASNWVLNVSSSGDFYKNSSVTITSGINGIPTGWTVHNS